MSAKTGKSLLDQAINRIVERRTPPAPKKAAPVEEKQPRIKNDKHISLRITDAQWEVLRELSYETKETQQSLLLAGMNLLLESHGKKPLPSAVDGRTRG